jgi:hypothetical protein
MKTELRTIIQKTKGRYEEHKKENIYAECSIHHDKDIPILTMERVSPTEFKKGEKKPSLVDHVDCAQVVYTTDGRLVAYDYA